MSRLAMSLPPAVNNTGEHSCKVTVVGRPRPDDEPVVSAGHKRKAPFEAAVHLEPSKVVLNAAVDRRHVSLHSFCKLACSTLAFCHNSTDGICCELVARNIHDTKSQQFQMF
jgi:hypothetical protein